MIKWLIETRSVRMQPHEMGLKFPYYCLPSVSLPQICSLFEKREKAEIEMLLGQLNSPSKDIFQLVKLFEVFQLKIQRLT